MKYRTTFFTLLSNFAIWTSQAASVTPIWQPLAQQFSSYQLINTKDFNPRSFSNNFSSNSPYQLSFLKTNTTDKIVHRRFQAQYKNIDIWGYHVLLHTYPNNKTMVTGHHVTQIEHDITTTPQLTANQALALVLKKTHLNSHQIKYPVVKKIIFIDEKTHKAKLAYFISYFSATPLANPNIIVDASSAAILKQWNNLKTHQVQRAGIGLGGNTNSPTGGYRYSNTPQGTGQLPPFDVTVNGSSCSMQSTDVQVRSTNLPLPSPDPFPLDLEEETMFPVYQFPCFDNGNRDKVTAHADGNIAQSPNNDTMFHATRTLEMLKSLGLTNPIGSDLPLRLFNHVEQLDNAYSIDTYKDSNGSIISHQQIVIGNGDTTFWALAMGTVAHELCHNVINQFSQLVYADQSGGINESFADQCDLALKAYISNVLNYSWWWDGQKLSYTIDQNETQNPATNRNFYQPSLDGNSIDSASDYSEGMDVHFSSGVFNHALYRIAMVYGFGPIKAFQFNMDAMANYWVPNTTFAYGACGVIQAAFDNKLDYTKVSSAYDDVNAHCKLFKADKQVANNPFTLKNTANWKSN